MDNLDHIVTRLTRFIPSPLTRFIPSPPPTILNKKNLRNALEIYYSILQQTEGLSNGLNYEQKEDEINTRVQFFLKREKEYKKIRRRGGSLAEDNEYEMHPSSIRLILSCSGVGRYALRLDVTPPEPIESDSLRYKQECKFQEEVYKAWRDGRFPLARGL